MPREGSYRDTVAFEKEKADRNAIWEMQDAGLLVCIYYVDLGSGFWSKQK